MALVQEGHLKSLSVPSSNWVQSSRWDEAIYLIIPGTSCLATIVLSLRDKTIHPLERLSCGALQKKPFLLFLFSQS
jgi:hypothetical protein